MKWQHGRRQTRGMTLIELLMAIVVLTIGLVALLGLFSIAGTLNAKAKDTMFAVDVATRALQQVRGKPFGAIDPSTTYTETTPGCSDMNVTIDSEVDPDYATLKRITVSIDWQGHSRGHMKVETIVGVPIT